MTPRRLSIRPTQTQPPALGLALGFFSCLTLAASAGLGYMALARVAEGAAASCTLGLGLLSLALLLFSCHLWPSFLFMLAGRVQLELAPTCLHLRRSVCGISLPSQSLALPLAEDTRLCLQQREQLVHTLKRHSSATPQTTYAVCLCSPLQEYTLQEYHDRAEAMKLVQALREAYPQLPTDTSSPS